MYYILSLLFYCSVIVCFFVELCLLNFMQASFLNILLCFYILLAFETTSKPKLIFTACALMAKDFVLHGLFGLPLLYLAPLTFGAIQLKKRLFYPTSLFHYLFVAMALLLQIYLIEGVILGLYQPIRYAFFAIFGTIIVMFCFLKCRFKGEQDNRL